MEYKSQLTAWTANNNSRSISTTSISPTTMSSHRLPSNNPLYDGPVRRKPSSPGAASLSSLLKRVALAGLLIVGLWWIYVWRSGIVQDFFDPNDKVQKHRPAFRYVEPYSDKHRYRPAASPVITAKDKLGRTKLKGKYTP